MGTHPPFRSTVQHKAFITEIVYPDAEATEDHWGHLMCHPVHFKMQKGTQVPALFETGGKTPLVTKESLTGRCFISATGLDGTRTTGTTLEKPLPGETIFDIEACARAPAQSMYVQGSVCTHSGSLDPVHVSPAFQAEEKVVCNLDCMTTQLGCGLIACLA